MRQTVLFTLTSLAVLCAVAAPERKEVAMKAVQGKHVVMVVAQQGFRDEEFTKPHDLFTAAGAAITVAALRSGTATGALGATITVNTALSDVRGADADAVVFIGGPGAQVYFDNPAAHALARDAVRAGKIVAAICIAPATLANAGILKGKQATCFASEEATLRKGGAVLCRQAVVSDGNIITANGPAAAGAFGEAILKALGTRSAEPK